VKHEGRIVPVRLVGNHSEHGPVLIAVDEVAAKIVVLTVPVKSAELVPLPLQRHRKHHTLQQMLDAYAQQQVVVQRQDVAAGEPSRPDNSNLESEVTNKTKEDSSDSSSDSSSESEPDHGSPARKLRPRKPVKKKATTKARRKAAKKRAPAKPQAKKPRATLTARKAAVCLWGCI
jgi:hypothetical protein